MEAFQPGPMVTDLLTEQHHHRSEDVWAGADYVRNHLYKYINYLLNIDN